MNKKFFVQPRKAARGDGKCVFTAKHIKIIIKAKAASSSPGMLQGAHEAFGFVCHKYLEHVFSLKHSMNLLFVRISFSILGMKHPEGSSKYIYIYIIN